MALNITLITQLSQKKIKNKEKDWDVTKRLISYFKNIYFIKSTPGPTGMEEVRNP